MSLWLSLAAGSNSSTFFFIFQNVRKAIMNKKIREHSERLFTKNQRVEGVSKCEPESLV